MNNISKRVLLLDGAKEVGYILNVALDENFNRTGYYMVENESENEFFVDINDIIWGENVVFVENISKLLYVEKQTLSVCGKCVFDVFGHDFGVVKYIEFFHNKAKKFVTNLCEIDVRLVECCGDFVLLKNKKNKKKEKKVKKNDENFVEKVSLSMSSYVGKVATYDVLGKNNERLIEKGVKVTKEIFEKAKMHNRLNELFFAIK